MEGHFRIGSSEELLERSAGSSRERGAAPRGEGAASREVKPPQEHSKQLQEDKEVLQEDWSHPKSIMSGLNRITRRLKMTKIRLERIRSHPR